MFMKRYLLLALFALGCYAQLMGQSQDDQASLLQICLDLPELQEKYPTHTDGTVKQLFIMQHGVSFAPSVKVLKNGIAPVFYSKQEINENKIEAYFLFQDFTFNEDTATVAFVYQNKDKNNQPALSVVNLDFKKTGDSWSILNAKVKNQ